MSRAVLSIGSNLGDRLAHLKSVVDALGPRVRAVSSVYSTARGVVSSNKISSTPWWWPKTSASVSTTG